MTIHQVTFLYQDCEIAYSEGESVEWAFEEANEQFKASPYACMNDVSVIWVQYTDEDDHHGGKRQCLDYWDALTTLC